MHFKSFSSVGCHVCKCADHIKKIYLLCITKLRGTVMHIAHAKFELNRKNYCIHMAFKINKNQNLNEVKVHFYPTK